MTNTDNHIKLRDKEIINQHNGKVKQEVVALFKKHGIIRESLGFSWGLGLFFGPIALIVSFFLSGFCEHGVRWR